MKRALVGFLIALVSLPALAADEAHTPKDMVVLTIGGLVGTTNRGPLDPKRDSPVSYTHLTLPTIYSV